MSKQYETVIGLEVHVELATKTKIFCGCSTAFGGAPNTHTCPVCTGMPGSLPVLNKQVVEYAMAVGLAANCQINQYCKFDRKNYFYPDNPQNYQISQLYLPICHDGWVEIETESGVKKKIGIHEIHMEEDAGKLVHDEWEDCSLVDYNRSGVPLIEIVSEPDIRSSKEAKSYLDGIRAILGYLDISDCKMQEGSIRCDVNVSVRPKGSDTFGTRVEMKNVNSFSAAERAIDYEAARQIAVLEKGGVVLQETRRWDDVHGVNEVLRSKEDAQDYRYFPDPDLLTIVVDEEHVEELRRSIPELPVHRLQRYLKDYGLPYFDSNLLVENVDKAEFFEKTAALGAAPKSVTNWLLGDVTKVLNEKNCLLSDTKLTPEKLAEMIALIDKKEISNNAGKTVLDEIIFSDKTPAQVVEEKGLRQISDSSFLEKVADEVLAANPKAVEDYKKGKTNVVGFLVGQCMRASKGQGNPTTLREIMEKKLAAL